MEILGGRDIEIEGAGHLQSTAVVPVNGGTTTLAWVHSMVRSVWPQRSGSPNKIAQAFLICSRV